MLILPLIATAQSPKQTADYLSSVQQLNTAILENPTFEAYYNRALVLFILGDYNGAIRDNTHALELNSADKNVYLNRGKAKDAIGDYQSAIKDFDKVLTGKMVLLK